ncbi:MAG: hypothetical protein FJW39_35260 [Acidobacteria bacterium]|nr:hypothetical protein [Acidobacteriota bacterium]
MVLLPEVMFRRHDVLKILSMERGLLIGWEDRALYKHPGPKIRPRVYTREDTLRIGIAKYATQAGISPVAIWALLNQYPHAIQGNVRYALGTLHRPMVYEGQPAWFDPDRSVQAVPQSPDQNDIAFWELVPESQPYFDRKAAEFVRQHSRFGTIYVVDLTAELQFLNGRIDRYVAEEAE